MMMMILSYPSLEETALFRNFHLVLSSAVLSALSHVNRNLVSCFRVDARQVVIRRPRPRMHRGLHTRAVSYIDLYVHT